VILTANDYYAFGSQLAGRGYVAGGKYRYGFNGQEKDDEVYGEGNLNTAEFWEYDTRLGRRWNVDPVVKPWESSYAVFYNNPICINDILGLDGKFNKDESGTVSSWEGDVIDKQGNTCTGNYSIDQLKNDHLNPITLKAVTINGQKNSISESNTVVQLDDNSASFSL
jgi:hypothetical protein